MTRTILSPLLGGFREYACLFYFLCCRKPTTSERECLGSTSQQSSSDTLSMLDCTKKRKTLFNSRENALMPSMVQSVSQVRYYIHCAYTYKECVCKEELALLEPSSPRNSCSFFCNCTTNYLSEADIFPSLCEKNERSVSLALNLLKSFSHDSHTRFSVAWLWVTMLG